MSPRATAKRYKWRASSSAVTVWLLLAWPFPPIHTACQALATTYCGLGFPCELPKGDHTVRVGGALGPVCVCVDCPLGGAPLALSQCERGPPIRRARARGRGRAPSLQVLKVTAPPSWKGGVGDCAGTHGERGDTLSNSWESWAHDREPTLRGERVEGGEGEETSERGEK